MKTVRILVAALVAAFLFLALPAEAQTPPDRLEYDFHWGFGRPTVLASYDLKLTDKPVLGGRLSAGPALGSFLDNGASAAGFSASIKWEADWGEVKPYAGIGGYGLVGPDRKLSGGLAFVVGLRFDFGGD